VKSYRCGCNSDYQSGGFCPHCNSQRIEIVNDEMVQEILAQSDVKTEISEIKDLAQYIYAPQYAWFLEHLKRSLPIEYSQRIDGIIDYIWKQRSLIDITQNFGRFLKDDELKKKMIKLHKKLNLELKTVQQFKTDLAYIDSIKIFAQLNAIENFFNQAQVYEKMEGIKNEN